MANSLIVKEKKRIKFKDDFVIQIILLLSYCISQRIKHFFKATIN
jgi:hypothetical protein